MPIPWPDPTQPGLPLGPDLKQYHWLQSDPKTDPFPVLWTPDCGYDPATVWVDIDRIGTWAYHGICPWPATWEDPVPLPAPIRVGPASETAPEPTQDSI